MDAEAFKAVWEVRIRTAADDLVNASGAQSVLVALFDGPWMSGRDPAIMGLAGKPGADVFRIARDLRLMADTLEKHSATIAMGEELRTEERRPGPVRD